MGNLTKELVIKTIKDTKPRPRFRNVEDRIAFVVHAAFIASGFRLLVTGPAFYRSHTLKFPSIGEVCIKKWNYHKDGFYGFIYSHPELGSKKVEVEVVSLAGALMVDVCRVGDYSELASLNIIINEYAPAPEETHRCFLKNFGKLVACIEKDLVNRSYTKHLHPHSRHVADGSGGGGNVVHPDLKGHGVGSDCDVHPNPKRHGACTSDCDVHPNLKCPRACASDCDVLQILKRFKMFGDDNDNSELERYKY